MKVEAPEIKIFIEAQAKAQMDAWVEMAKGEVSGMGLVEQIDGGFIVTQVFLPFQKCTGADTDIEAESVAKLMIEIETEGLDSSKLRYWWHSHADMKVFWSTTDQGTIDGFRPEDYFISTVVNKKGETLSRVDYYHPFRLTFHDVVTDIRLPDFGEQEICKKLFDERVKERGHFMTFDFSLFEEDAFDLSQQEIINKVCSGEMDWQEAQELLSGENEKDPWDGWEGREL